MKYIFLWVLAYGILFTGSEHLSNFLNVPHIITSFVILFYALALIVFLNKQRKKRYLFGLKIKSKHLNLYLFIPLVIMPVINFIVLDNVYDFLTIILFVGVCIVEEIFFRDYIFFELNKKFSTLVSVVLSNAIFALFHTVNFFNGFDLLFILMQVLSSFAIGVYFGAITVKQKSLLPAILAHLVINVTGTGAIRVSRLVWAILIGTASLIYLSLGLALLYKRKKKTLEKV